MSRDFNQYDILHRSEKAERAAPQAITVAVSLFNYERFVVECLDSIASQTHQPLELIIVDDQSTRDQSVPVVCAWLTSNEARFDRAVLIRHRVNRGLAAARNSAFALARTDYVFVMDADNRLYPRAIARLQEAARERTYDAAYSQIENFGDQTGLGQADVWSRRRFQRGNYVDAMALVRTRSFRQVGQYSHIEGGWEDYDFWCKFIEAGMTAIFVPEILCRYRVHAASMLRQETDTNAERLKVELTVRHPWLRMI